MRLRDWLKAQGRTEAWLAIRIGRTQQAVNRYVNGDQIPGRGTMIRIVEVTRGAVTPNDFYDLPSLTDREEAA